MDILDLECDHSFFIIWTGAWQISTFVSLLCLYQVNLGPKQRPEKAPAQLRVGNMIGVYLREYRHEWPQVGKVTTIEAESITVHWFSGTATSTWTPLYRRGGKGREPYIQTIQSSSIITYPFYLTGAAKLPQEVQRQLKEKQEEGSIRE